MRATPNLKLKSVLFAKGLTQRELAFSVSEAGEVSLDESRLSRIVRGYERPTPEIREAIARALGLPEDEIFLKTQESFTTVTLRAHSE